MGVVYRATNTVNGKVYIGKTLGTVDARRKKHEHDSKKPKYIFHRAIKKYGKEAFKWEVLHHADTDRELFEIESEEMHKHSSLEHSHGYNMVDNESIGARYVKKHIAVSRLTNLLDRANGIHENFTALDREIKEGTTRMKDGFSYEDLVLMSIYFAEEMVASLRDSISKIKGLPENARVHLIPNGGHDVRYE